MTTEARLRQGLRDADCYQQHDSPKPSTCTSLDEFTFVIDLAQKVDRASGINMHMCLFPDGRLWWIVEGAFKCKLKYCPKESACTRN